MPRKVEALANLVSSYEFARYADLMQREVAELRALVGRIVCHNTVRSVLYNILFVMNYTHALERPRDQPYVR